jgi:hypothetical protein
MRWRGRRATQLEPQRSGPLARLDMQAAFELALVPRSGRQWVAVQAVRFDLAIPTVLASGDLDRPVVASAEIQAGPGRPADTRTAVDPQELRPEAVASVEVRRRHTRLAALVIDQRQPVRRAVSDDQAASTRQRLVTPAPAIAPPAAAAVVEASVVEAAASAAVRPTQAAAATAAANAVTNS